MDMDYANRIIARAVNAVRLPEFPDDLPDELADERGDVPGWVLITLMTAGAETT